MTNEVKKCPSDSEVRWTEEEFNNHLKLNLTDEAGSYSAAVVVAALYKKIYGKFPKIGMSGAQAECADSIIPRLPESHLSSGVEGVEKKENTPNYDYENSWNACCDAHKLAGYRRVPSVEEIAEVIRKTPNVEISGTIPSDWLIATAIHDLMEKGEGEK